MPLYPASLETDDPFKLTVPGMGGIHQRMTDPSAVISADTTNKPPVANEWISR